MAEIDYNQEMKKMITGITKIVTDMGKDSEKYGDVQYAFKEALKVNKLPEIEKKYIEIKKNSKLTPSQKYITLVNYFQQNFNLPGKLFGLAGRFGEKEYLTKYGDNARKFYSDMRKKYDGSIEEILKDMNKKKDNLIKSKSVIKDIKERITESIKIQNNRIKIKSKIVNLKKQIQLLADDISDDASQCNEAKAKSYFKGLKTHYNNEFKKKLDPVLKKGQVVEAFEITKEILGDIRAYIINLVPSNMAGHGKTPLVICRDELFKKHDPTIVKLQDECNKLINKYST